MATGDMKKTLLEMMEEDGTPVSATVAADQTKDLFGEDNTHKKQKQRRRYPILGRLRDHQVRALNEAEEKPGHAWFMDPGAGKTLTAIAEAGALYEDDKIDGVIVIAPDGPHKQWLDEQFPLWAGFRWRGIHNKQPPKMVIQKFLDAKITSLGLLCINYDALRTAKGQALLNAFYKKFPRIYLVLDEAHKAKNPRSLRTKEALKLGLRSAYRRALTGTPILKGLEDLWTQYEFVEPGLAWEHEPIKLTQRGQLNTFGFVGYRAHFCKLIPVPNNPRASIIVGYRNEAELRHKVKGHSTRVMSDEFMKGEKPDFIKVNTEMNAEQTRAYAMMKEHLLAQMEQGVITAQNALVQMQKLQQIAAGFLYHEEGDGWDPLSNTKNNAAMDLIEQLDEPVIVWAPYRAQQQMLMIDIMDRNERNLWPTRVIYTRELVDAWKDDPTGILLGNQSSGLGVGMNLQHAAANIYMSNTFSAEARWQSVKRTDRIGQHKQVRVWDLVAPGTIDTKALKALKNKEDVSRRTIDQLRDMI